MMRFLYMGRKLFREFVFLVVFLFLAVPIFHAICQFWELEPSVFYVSYSKPSGQRKTITSAFRQSDMAGKISRPAKTLHSGNLT